MTMDVIGATGGIAWTPSDSDRLPRLPRGFQVASEGDVALEYADGSSVVWPGCATGFVHAHFHFTKILETGTTATGIVVAF